MSSLSPGSNSKDLTNWSFEAVSEQEGQEKQFFRQTKKRRTFIQSRFCMLNETEYFCTNICFLFQTQFSRISGLVAYATNNSLIILDNLTDVKTNFSLKKILKKIN